MTADRNLVETLRSGSAHAAGARSDTDHPAEAGWKALGRVASLPSRGGEQLPGPVSAEAVQESWNAVRALAGVLADPAFVNAPQVNFERLMRAATGGPNNPFAVLGAAGAQAAAVMTPAEVTLARDLGEQWRIREGLIIQKAQALTKGGGGRPNASSTPKMLDELERVAWRYMTETSRSIVQARAASSLITTALLPSVPAE